MKKIILFLALALTSHVSFCQNTYPWPSNGSVGIGTTTPLAPLDVKLTTNQHIQFVPDLNGGFPGFSGLVCINDNNSSAFYISRYRPIYRICYSDSMLGEVQLLVSNERDQMNEI